MRFLVPGIQEFGQVGLVDLSRWRYGVLDLLSTRRGSSLPCQQNIVAACCSFIEPSADAIGTIDGIRELLDFHMKRSVCGQVGLSDDILAIGIS